MEGMNNPQNHFEIELDESEKIVRDILREIDEGRMRDLLFKQFESVGNGEMIRRFVTIENIKIAPEASNAYGTYSIGEIEINPYVFEKNAERSAIAITEDIAFKMRSRGWHLHEGAGKSSGNKYFDDLLVLLNSEYREAISELIKLHKEANEVESSAQFQQEVKRAVMNVKVIHTVFHEELHALTDRATDATNLDDILNEKIGFTSFQQISAESDSSSDEVTLQKTGSGIDEGVTQIFSLRLAKDYLQQNPPERVSEEILSYVLHESRVGYSREMHVTEIFTAFLATITDVTEEEILQNLFKAYTDNEEPVPENFQELVEAAMPLYAESYDGKTLGESVTSMMQTALSLNYHEADSGSYRAIELLLRDLPEDKQEMFSLKLKSLNEKYFGPLEE